MGELLGLFGFLVVLLRAAILCFQTIAIGGILFLLIVGRGGALRREELLRPSWKLIRGSAFSLALAQLFFVFSNTLLLTYSVDIPMREVLGANFALAASLAILAGLAVAFWPSRWRMTVNPIVLVPAAVILATSVMTSHSASRMDNRTILVSLTALHYLATASWIGGLPYLLIAMKRGNDAEFRVRISRNFSRLAQASVALLLAAGLALSIWYVGSWNLLYGTAYGLMLLTKVAFLGCLLLLGAANLYIVRGLGFGSETGSASLVRFGEVEIGIGLTIILVAASMTSQPPATDLAQDRVTFQEIAARYWPRMPRVSSPDVKQLSKTTREIIAEAEARGQKAPVAYMPGQFGAETNGASDIAWSEYNHNWAGIIVFLMGILALLSRSRYFSWAKIWPLTFLGLAAFLFLRADPENWPLGPNGFWESFAVSDVLQHRAAVVLLIVFALFQWAVETNRLKSHAAALVFPAVCAIGGIVLLTHTHALNNVKEEMLVELSHTPLAIFGIIAGWSRWLELRLPEENQARKYLAWVWPVCFIVVGMILMDYHEISLPLS